MWKVQNICFCALFMVFLCCTKFISCSENVEESAYLNNYNHKPSSSYPWSKLTLEELANLMENDEEMMVKRAGMWFGPRLGKRSKRSITSSSMDTISSDLRDEIIDELLENSRHKMGNELVQGSPWIVFLMSGKQPIEKQNLLMRPRLGREAGENGADPQRTRPPFAPRLGKRGITFSPRLGRQLFAEFNEQ